VGRASQSRARSVVDHGIAVNMLHRASLAVLLVALPALALVTIWYPEWRHFRADWHEVSLDEARAVAEATDLARLAEINAFDFGPLVGTDPAAWLGWAETAWCGEPLALATAATSPTFAAADLAAELSATQLYVASLGAPDLYLRAHASTGDPAWLDRASTYLRAWWAHERTTRIPRGLQWNDHALAARVYVLTRYWEALARAGRLTPDTARWILDAVELSTALLEKEDSFTFRTNHGDRFDRQLPWYLGADGFILEHSAGYHGFGVRLVGYALRYRTLLGAPTEPQLAERYRRAVELYAALRRADGTLAPLGDTEEGVRDPPVALLDVDGRAMAVAERAWPAGDAAVFLPVSGIAVWKHAARDTAPEAQLVATWSRVATEAHKHGDDLTVLLYAGGHQLLTSVGYWPYDSPLRGAAIGWCAGNGPHSPGEAAPGARTNAVSGYTAAPGLLALRSERPDGVQFERRIVEREVGTWIVRDAAAAAAVELRTCWHVGPEFAVEWRAAERVAILRSGAFVASLRFIGPGLRSVEHVRGGPQRFPGAVAARGKPETTSTFVVTADPVAGYAVVVRTGDPVADDQDFASLDAVRPAAPVLRVDGPAIAATQARVDAQYRELRAVWPEYRPGYWDYRVLASYLVGALVLLQAIAVAAVAHFVRRGRCSPRVAFACGGVAVIGWCALSAWLGLVYFGS
jgi:hypothetical protein